MPVFDPSAASADKQPDESFPVSVELGPGLWPGLAPLDFGDSQRFRGRGRELERLFRLFNRPQTGQTPMVWLTGDAGVGKTSLVLAGLLPRLQEGASHGFEWFPVTLSHGAEPRQTMDAIVAAILKRTISDEDEGGLDLDGRLRQFELLMNQDSGEAVEYLASCYRKNVAAASERSGDSEMNCLIFVDQCDGMVASAPPGELEALVSFLRELSFAGCFPCLIAMRSLHYPAIRDAAENAGCGKFGTEIEVGTLEIESVRDFFESAPSAGIESGRTRVKHELLDLMIRTAGSDALPFVSESLRRLSASDPLAEEIGLEDVRWAGGVHRTFGEVAESVVNWLPGSHDSFFGLMAALHPVGQYIEGKQNHLATDPISVPYLLLTGDAELGRMVDALVDSRVLLLTGPSAEKARVSWALPDGLLKWERAVRWFAENDRLLARANEFDRARENWESEYRTPVKLLHSTRALSDARELLEYHRRREFLSGELKGYLEQSVDFDERLGADWRKRRWIRLGLIAGAVLVGIVMVVVLTRFW